MAHDYGTSVATELLARRERRGELRARALAGVKLDSVRGQRPEHVG